MHSERVSPSGLRRSLVVTAVATGLVCTQMSVALSDPAPSPPPQTDVSKQRAEALRLAQEAAGAADVVKATELALVKLSLEANKALEAQTQAEQSRDAAYEERDMQRERHKQAKALVERKKAEMGRWASTSYRGGNRQDVMDLVSLLGSEKTSDLGRKAVMVTQVGKIRGEVVNTVSEAERIQAESAQKAEEAAARAEEEAQRATKTREEADQLVKAQTELLLALQQQSADTLTAAQKAQLDATLAVSRRGIKKRSGLDNAVTGQTGTCTGGEITRYGNGLIPRQALCELEASPNHHLRADAAFSFDLMNKAYEAEFGISICITDSYRDYPSQVSVKIAKPHLAATPGTSNHGWGTALDLCGGINVFDSAQHNWMKANSTLYGWFHPSWAQIGGSKPEAWHWEFAG